MRGPGIPIGRLGRLARLSALCAALALAACGGSGPTDAEIGQALLVAVSGGHPDKGDKPAQVKESKCSKADGDAWECDFMLDGAGRHGRLVKMDAGWTLVGALR